MRQLRFSWREITGKCQPACKHCYADSRGAAHFGLEVSGQPVLGWRDRSIAASADGPRGRCWLRVVCEELGWAQGDHALTGNADADALDTLPKPRLPGMYEWTEGEWRRQRAEVMTPLPRSPCPATDAAPGPLDLDDGWWQKLRSALQQLAGTPTRRVSVDQERVDLRVHAAFSGGGATVSIRRWETVHGDLRWADISDPLGIVNSVQDRPY
ncbi:hypothetical protein [Actinacidiphila sp. ITFR-21]|uniref:hypothetical protein n=1 Tax=Actinacidiphila sp. ITFR-21 TaxID=3075199 RepID=UPI00288A6505|nr:hypothetical protein [Streptomyces sp. ITFR-21]WNI14625.1 hypothetical protein RLT57_03080 [Streptomyces sp. ITFR-21]